MKRILIIAIILSSIAISCEKTADPVTTKHITISEAGTLSSLLSEEEILTMTELTISGPINGSDIRVLRNMAKNCALSILNLRDASIVSGGNAYIADYGGIMLYTTEDVISTKMFSSCGKLTSIVLPKNLKSIGEEAFYKCLRLTGVTWPDELDSIGDQAFYLSGLSGEMVLPSSLRVIGRRAFYQTELQKVTIQSDISVPNYDTYYFIGGNSPFAYCEHLEEVVVCEGCTILEVGFQDCIALSSVALPNTLTTLGATSSSSCSYIFDCCQCLQTITLPDNLQTIGKNCFYNSGITDIVIPASVQNIKKWAFAKTPLTTVKVKWANPLLVNNNVFDDTNLENATLYVPIGTKETYQNSMPWKLFGNIIEE